MTEDRSWNYNKKVFDATRCRHDSCNSLAWGDSGFCPDHHPEPEGYKTRMIELLRIKPGSSILRESLDWSYMDLSGMDLSNRDFRYCRFRSVNFSGADLSGSRFAMCLMGDSIARDSNLKGCWMISVMAAGSDFSGSDFTGSDLVNVNFIGIKAHGTCFDESDLFYSRFISADLEKSSFRDCNLKRVDFSGAVLRGIDFEDSNPEESYIMDGGTG